MSRAAAEKLAKNDPRLGEIIRRHPVPRRTRNRDIYLALIQSIIAQQLSVKAADTIAGRFLDLFDGGYPHPEMVRRKRVETLRKAGLSRMKAGYIKEVAQFHLKQGMAYETLSSMSDEEVIAYLTSIKGVGKWTVEMLLMFSLNRNDILPLDDVGIQRGMRALYGLSESGPALRQIMEQIGEKWRPYRTLACRYLWRAF